MEIHRGQVVAYDSTNHKADVMLLGSMSGIVLGVPVADHVPPDAMVADTACGVMFFGEGDAGVVVCTFDGTPFNPVKDLDFDAKGDLLVGKASDDYDRLAVGSNDQLLVAASGETLGMKWRTQDACRVYLGSLGVPHATWTIPNFTSEIYDTAEMHSNSVNPSRITIQTSGAHLVVASGQWAGMGTGISIVELLRNGGYLDGDRRTTFSWCTQQATHLGALSAGDYIQCRWYQDTGATRTVYPSFVVQYMGKTTG